MRLEKAPRGMGFDTASYVSPEVARKFKDAGFKFVMRYIRRDRHVNDEPDLSGGGVSLSRRELDGLLGVGLGVGLVQFGWKSCPLTVEHGRVVGNNAADNAFDLGFPRGITIFYNGEFSGGPTWDAIKGHLNPWGHSVSAKGAEAGLYEGFFEATGRQLYWELPLFRKYWKCAMGVPMVEVRGPALIQGVPQKLFGISVDPDLACIDGHGGRFTVGVA